MAISSTPHGWLAVSEPSTFCHGSFCLFWMLITYTSDLIQRSWLLLLMQVHSRTVSKQPISQADWLPSSNSPVAVGVTSLLQQCLLLAGHIFKNLLQICGSERFIGLISVLCNRLEPGSLSDFLDQFSHLTGERPWLGSNDLCLLRYGRIQHSWICSWINMLSKRLNQTFKEQATVFYSHKTS